jgi:hypothetical protein
LGLMRTAEGPEAVSTAQNRISSDEQDLWLFTVALA